MTKPGGVTISECLQKRLPVFIYHALPGQEEMNLNLLKERKLVIDIRNWDVQKAEERFAVFFQSIELMKKYQTHVNEYLEEMSDRKIEDVLKEFYDTKKHSPETESVESLTKQQMLAVYARFLEQDDQLVLFIRRKA